MTQAAKFTLIHKRAQGKSALPVKYSDSPKYQDAKTGRRQREQYGKTSQQSIIEPALVG
ncbi:MAG: hypothetical protein FWG81_01430 [Betaproteobacteria bacterium]|nr:hypothetical protein [Betaproteobacteria bacterium]